MKRLYRILGKREMVLILLLGWLISSPAASLADQAAPSSQGEAAAEKEKAKNPYPNDLALIL
ncbi:MAG: hypothetical protein HYY56_05545 [Candidatus Omnitrophica bacterium]|nr:hypothetical protein [Candidatus Omnitrophota bacterium]